MDSKPNSTIYVNNLNEKVKKEELKKSLYHLFSQFGSILDIVALKTIKMRGQAFIVFKDIASASAALRSLQGCPFYNKPMRLDFAHTESEAIQKMKGTFRLKKKDEDGKEGAKKKKEKRTGDAAKNGLDHFSSFAEIDLNADADAVPNQILFVSNLPADCAIDIVASIFGQHPGYKEVRSVPSRNDIAFVEYESEQAAASARDSLIGFKITPSNPINITFAKR